MLRIFKIIFEPILIGIFLAAIIIFQYFAFQVDAGKPLDEIKISTKEIPTPEQLCQERLMDTEQRFLVSPTPNNWKQWSRALKVCHVTP